jgi:hypothetical protein
VDRLEFKRRVAEILNVYGVRQSAHDTLVDKIMIAHDECVESAIEEYAQLVDDANDRPRGRSSLECPEDVQLVEVTDR